MTLHSIHLERTGTPKELLDACVPPVWVHARLRSALHTHRRNPAGVTVRAIRMMSRWRWQGAALALTAVLSLAWVMDSRHFGRAAGAGEFMALTELGALPEGDEVWLVAAELPQQQLAAMGLPFDPARAGERVSTQVLLRSNGEMLAVRLVR